MQIGILGILQIIFIVLKVLEVINWSWWLVFIPAYIGIVLALFAIAIFLLAMGRLH